MVLSRALPVLLVLAAAGCLPRAPAPVRLAQRTPVAVAYVLDADPRRGSAPTEVPPELQARVAALLDARNLEAQPLPPERYTPFFRRVTDSSTRYQHLVELVPEAPLVLLVETRAVFFSQISGRYRWDVYTQLTVGRGGQPSGAARTASQALVAVLPYDYPGEPAAVALVSEDVARRVGELFDGMLATTP